MNNFEIFSAGRQNTTRDRETSGRCLLANMQSSLHRSIAILPTQYTVGWVNLYQKFEIEKYTVCGKLILPKK